MIIAVVCLSGCKEKKKYHEVNIGVREDGKLVTWYEGSGMASEIGWGTQDQTNYNIDFKGRHMPAGKAFVPGDTNYLDSFVTGTAFIEGTNDDFLVCNLQINSEIPVEIKFPGISELNTTTNDAHYHFDSGKHQLRFKGRIISIFDAPNRKVRP